MKTVDIGIVGAGPGGIAVLFNEEFESMRKDRDESVVVTGNGQYRARAVVLAFGSNIPVDLGVYGEAKTIARKLDNVLDHIAARLLACSRRRIADHGLHPLRKTKIRELIISGRSIIMA